MNKVLIVDDHPLVQWALGRVVQGLYPTVRLVMLGSGRALREHLSRSDSSMGLDLVLLDLDLHDEQGLDLLELLCRCDPKPTVLVMSDTERPGDAVRAVDAGAMGFVPKRLGVEEFKEAMLLAQEGQVFFPSTPPETALVGQSLNSSYQTITDLKGLGFTPRQADVVSLISQGKQNKQIAQTMGVSLDTAKDHVTAVLRILKVKNRSDVVWAVAELQKRQREQAASAPPG